MVSAVLAHEHILTWLSVLCCCRCSCDSRSSPLPAPACLPCSPDCPGSAASLLDSAELAPLLAACDLPAGSASSSRAAGPTLQRITVQIDSTEVGLGWGAG